ncbi:MAG TPA: 2,3-bisphosphoglycerate-independent phosphoglycerate mutase [Candidatus Binatia bacterium]|jgi:2,3-bisphosphoglycerate-independent phosphoglycerate mutase|nr:2,3-bisphosphoglycerate-independent phosphoglycerate mutase [Candidatus Binatia bacterium]
MAESRPKPVVLLILDGWGVAPPGEGNPLEAANTPVFDELVTTFPTVTVRASGEAVGLSWGEMGNSEVGHLTIGAGKIFYQSLPRINLSIQTGEFFRNETFAAAAAHAKKNGSTFHILGILSPGNVHGSDEHIHAFLQFAKQQGLTDVVVHPVLDGRDAIYNTGIEFIRALLAKMREIGVGRIGSISGRFYAMDRDNRWDRIEKAYNAMCGVGDAKRYEDPIKAVEDSYAAKVYDEEFVPVIIEKDGKPVGPLKDGDALIFANFRPDRAREIAQAICIPSFSKFPRTEVKDLYFATMTEYEKGTPAKVAYPPEFITTCLAKVIADAGLKQMHIAETEKYAHVTFFLNGMREEEFPGEERMIIPSPRVSSYDQAPEMSTPKIADRIVKEVQAGTFDVIISNLANADMVGHTGKFEPTMKAAEAVDAALGKIVSATLAAGGVVVITADHGNGEEVLNLQTGELDKEHSTNPVPFLVIGEQWRGQASPSGEVIGGDLSLMPPVGMLADTAPTILKLLQVPQPKEMTGSPLI